MKTRQCKRGYLVWYLIYISAFLFGWELWEAGGFGSWEIWRITFLVLIQAGSHPPSFTLTFEFEQIQKFQNKTLMEPLAFTWFPPKIVNFAPSANGRTYSKKYAFQIALAEVIFKSREEDDPNSSDFSRTQGPKVQMTFSEIQIAMKVITHVKNIIPRVRVFFLEKTQIHRPYLYHYFALGISTAG